MTPTTAMISSSGTLCDDDGHTACSTSLERAVATIEWRVAPTRFIIGVVPAWSTYSYAFGPLVAIAAITVFVLILRWGSKRGRSVVAARPRSGEESEYGLLVVVSRPPDYIRGEMERRRLEAAGLRATLVQTVDGPRVMVWPADESKAKGLLAA